MIDQIDWMLDVACFHDPAGRRRVTIAARDDGLFSWDSEQLETVEAQNGLDPYDYWCPIGGGGLYASQQDAERAAREQTPWLSDQVC